MSNRLAPSQTLLLPDLPDGFTAVAYARLADGSLAIVGDDQNIATMLYERHLHPDLRERVALAKARLWTFDGEVLRFHFGFALETPFPHVARLPDGRWLIVAARCLGEPNARLFTKRGELIRRFMLGDAIEALKVDDDGGIWVGWFDEGIAQDWSVPGREWPPSASGLACFDDHGAVIWEPEPNRYLECESLNVADGKVWMLQLGDERLHCFSRAHSAQNWIVDLPYPSALAVDGGYALAAGGFDAELDVVLFKLGVDTGDVVWQAVLDTPPPSSTAARLLDGNGDRLHFIGCGEWRQWRVADVILNLGGPSA